MTTTEMQKKPLLPISVKHPSTPWMVRFPTGRRYFTDQDAAQNAIDQYLSGEDPVSKRDLDDLRLARRLLAGASLIDAVRYYIDHAGTASDRPVTELLGEWIEEEEADWRPKYLATIQTMKKLADSEFDGVALRDLTSESVRKMVFASKSPNVRWDTFVRFRSFLGWCKRQKLLKEMPLPQVKKPKNDGEIHFTKPDDVCRLLRYALEKHPSAAVPMALQLFTGIRTAELMRLDWSSVKIEQQLIYLASAVTKTDAIRVIDWWPDNLTTWMMLAKRKGKVAPAGYLKTKVRLQAEARALGIDIHQNALRHNYATYGVAFFQSAGRIALQMGHRKADTLFTHYRSFVTQAEGETYFKITPETVRTQTTEWWQQIAA